jgi:hypothetical protein
MRIVSWPWRAAILVVLVSTACSPAENNDVRGHGLIVASMSPVTQARVYEAAARGLLDVSDPTLSVLADPRRLPRTVGLVADGRLSSSVLAELKKGGVFKGTCEPPLKGKPGAPVCAAALPGYVLRFSPVFATRGDSVEVYVYMQQYDNAQSGHSQPRRYERAYQIVKRDGEWRAVREGNVSKEVRGESK